jgi:hypothetical protein
LTVNTLAGASVTLLRAVSIDQILRDGVIGQRGGVPAPPRGIVLYPTRFGRRPPT